MAHSTSFSTRLRFFLEYGLLRLIGGFMRVLPLDASSYLMGKLWQWIAPLTKRHKRALDHLATCLPDNSREENERIIRDMWMNLGRTAAESFNLDRLGQQMHRFTMMHDETLGPIEHNGRGVVLVSMHSGNWEVAVFSLIDRPFPAAGIYQAVKNPYVERYLTDMRKPFYPGGLHSKGHGTARRIMQWVKSGGTLTIMGDLREARGLSVPFFNQPAPSTPYPAMLARNLDVPLIVGRVRRTTGVNFVIESETIDVPRTDDKKADIAEATARIHAQFEAWIRDEPSQWMWAHKRWGRPDLA